MNLLPKRESFSEQLSILEDRKSEEKNNDREILSKNMNNEQLKWEITMFFLNNRIPLKRSKEFISFLKLVV